MDSNRTIDSGQASHYDFIMNVLLHICCGPCACYSVPALQQEGHKVTGYWFNPNIHPWTEYRQRLSTLREFAQIKNLPLIVQDDYPLEQWLAKAAENLSERCRHCYVSRLKATAEKARAENFDAFTTTLLYSKHQKHDWIIEAAQKISEESGVPFLYKDLREGWKEGIRISKELGLYRQQYCGCIYSEKERYLG